MKYNSSIINYFCSEKSESVIFAEFDKLLEATLKKCDTPEQIDYARKQERKICYVSPADLLKPYTI